MFSQIGLYNVALAVIFFFFSCSTAHKREKKDSEESIEFSNPVFEPVLADPTVVYDSQSERFYAYGTEDDWADGEGRRLVPILESENLIAWESVGDAFTDKPDWKKEGGIWAPDINYIDGKYFLYYAYSTWGDENPGIGLAIADEPKGPFRDQGKLFDSQGIGVPNSIDPYYYSDGAKNYMFWGSFSDSSNQGTYAIELSEDSREIQKGAEKVKIAAGDFEAVMIHKRGDYYYFFGSKGSCCEGENSTYRVLAARSENLLGPYHDKNGVSILDRGKGSLLLQGDTNFVGVGHNSNIITDKEGKDWMLYHAIEPTQGKLANGTSRRVLMLDKVKWEDGWPVIEGKAPSSYVNEVPKF